MSQSEPSLARLKAVFPKRLLANAALVLGAIGAAALLLFGSQFADTPGEPASAATEGSDSQATRVQLPAKKFAIAAIETHRASRGQKTGV